MKAEAAMLPASGLTPPAPTPREWAEACFMLSLSGTAAAEPLSLAAAEQADAAIENPEGAADQVLLLLAACAMPETPAPLLPGQEGPLWVWADAAEALPDTAEPFAGPSASSTLSASSVSSETNPVPAAAAPSNALAVAPSSCAPAPATAIPQAEPAVAAGPAGLHTAAPPPAPASEIAQSIVVAVQDGLQEAQIELHPAELGSVHIRIRVEDDKASLVFTVQNPQAREAVQTALPQLHLQLNGQGLQLADAQVFAQARPARPRPAPSTRTPPETGAPAPVSARRLRHSHLLDHYV